MASTAISDRDLRRVVIASLIGATIEWYDFFLYGTVAGIVFNKLFFPAQDPLIRSCLPTPPSQSGSSRARSVESYLVTSATGLAERACSSSR